MWFRRTTNIAGGPPLQTSAEEPSIGARKSGCNGLCMWAQLCEGSRRNQSPNCWCCGGIACGFAWRTRVGRQKGSDANSMASEMMERCHDSYLRRNCSKVRHFDQEIVV